MPWKPDFFIPLEPDDPRNRDRINPGGERIRVRLNMQGSMLLDFVVQYETPISDTDRVHGVVLRSDGSHPPHYDLADAFGYHRRVWLPAHLSAKQTVTWTIDDLKRHWPHYRTRFFQGLP